MIERHRDDESFLNVCLRYIDDVFFTSNESPEMIERILDEANQYHANIKLTEDVGKCVNFLDVCITNTNGTLSTSVYHKEVAEPPVIPFKSDHVRHTFRNIIRGVLVRAMRYSSTLEIFDKGASLRSINATLQWVCFLDLLFFS